MTTRGRAATGGAASEAQRAPVRLRPIELFVGRAAVARLSTAFAAMRKPGGPAKDALLLAHLQWVVVDGVPGTPHDCLARSSHWGLDPPRVVLLVDC